MSVKTEDRTALRAKLAAARAEVVAQRNTIAAMPATDPGRPEQQALLHALVEAAFVIETDAMQADQAVSFVCRQPPDPKVIEAIMAGMSAPVKPRKPKR